MFDFEVQDRAGKPFLFKQNAAGAFTLDSLADDVPSAEALIDGFAEAALQALHQFFTADPSIAPTHSGPSFGVNLPQASLPLSAREWLIRGLASGDIAVLKAPEQQPTGQTAKERDDRGLLRVKIQAALQQIIAAERLEAQQIEQQLQNQSSLQQLGTYSAAVGAGTADAAWGLLVWLKDVNDVVNPVMRGYRNFVNMRKASEDENFWQSYQEKTLISERRELVEMLGFDPGKIDADMLFKAWDVVDVIMDDPALRSCLGRFANDYLAAQHSLEYAEIAGGGIFELLLTLVLSAVSGGAAAVAVVASKARLVKLFDNAGNLLLEFATRTKILQKANKKRAAANSGGSNRAYSQLQTNERIQPLTAPSQPASASSAAKAPAQGELPPPSASQQPPSDPASSKNGTNPIGTKDQPDATAKKGGEPIDLKTGEERLTLVDGELEGLVPLRLTRIYRSGNPLDSGLGYGWSHSLLESLQWSTADKHLEFYNEEGRVISLPLPGESGCSHNVAEKLTLTRISEDHYTLSRFGALNGVKKHFRRRGQQGAATSRSASIFRLSAILDNYDNGVHFHYRDTQLCRVESTLGDALEIAASSCGRLEKIIRRSADNSTQLLAEYRYDSHGDLIEALDARGHSEKYQYRQHVISQRTLKSGYSFYFRWDFQGPRARCIRQWGDPIDGQQTYHYEFDWFDNGHGVVVTDTRGGKEEYHFNDNAQPIYHKDPVRAETRYYYNANGQLERVELPNKLQEHFHYDERGLLVKKIDVMGGEHCIDYDAESLPIRLSNPAGQTWKRSYNSRNQLASSTDP
ncbi:MAG: RHS repeat protein, partial [Cellvibrionaceae bacterium]|nr:RHS repeat protein [Cellvibrionaceae bacterium]